MSDLRYLAFEIVGRFGPFALIAPGFEADTLEPVPLEGDYDHCEGPVPVRVGDHHWLVASDQASRSFPIFALDGGRVGRLAAPHTRPTSHSLSSSQTLVEGGPS